MIINSLTLENFKSHKNTKLNFEDNISLILGNNGAGKSSILEAISYSLFKEVDGTLDDQMRKTTEEEDIVKQMSVTIEFNHEAVNYRLKRWRKGNQSFAELRYLENDRYVLKSNGDKNVNKDIQSILELDSKSFLNAVYIKQGEITDLIDKKAAEKKELISKLLNIDSFEKAWNEIRELQKVYENKIKLNDMRLSDKENFEKENENLKSKIEENEKLFKTLEREREDLEKIVQKEEIEVTKLQNDKTKYESLIDKKSIINDVLENINKNKDENENKLKIIEENEKRIEQLKKETQKLPHLEELMDLKSEIDENREKIKNLNDDISEINKYTNLKEGTQEAHDNIEPINNEVKELNNEKDKINQEYTEYKSIEAQINEKNKRLLNIKNELQKASEDATTLFNEYFSSPESIELKIKSEKEKTEEEIEKLRITRNDTENLISVLENNLESTSKSLEDLKLTEDICPICQSEISHEKHEELSKKYNDDISKYTAEINNLKKSNEDNEQNLKEKKDYLKEIRKISVEVLKDKNNEFQSLNNEIKELKQRIPEDYDGQKLLDDLESKIKEKEEILKELQEKDKQFFHAVNKLEEMRTLDEINKEIDELNKCNIEKTNNCHEIIQKYAVGDNLTLQIENLKIKEQTLHTLQGQVQDKEAVAKKINELSNEIISYTQNIKNIESDIENIHYDEEEYETVKVTYAQNKDKFEEKKKKVIQIETEIKKDNENLKNNNQKLNELEDIALEQKNLIDYNNLLEKLRGIYSKDGVQKDLRDNVRPLIEKETSAIFNEFDFDYSGITLDEDYNINIYNKNEVLDSKMISGGEKIVIALSLRLGIAKVLSENKTDLLILDEPTIHLDEERRKSLIDIIREIKSVPQMIIVTHDEEMESLSNNIIKIEKQNGISYIDNS